ncbi:MAG: glycosyltransferase family 39 protein [Candidatus Hydrogenedentota bacterium]
MTNQNAGNQWRDLAALLIGAFAFRLFFLLAMPRVVDSPDAVHYIQLAERFTEGEWFARHARLPVLLPLLGRFCYPLAGNMEWACRAVSFLASGLLIIPVYGLSRRIHGVRTARIAAFLVAIWPWLADYAGRVTPEALATTLWFAGAVTLLYGVRRGGAWAFAAPLCYFALHLARPEGLVLLIAAPVGAGVFLCYHSDQARLRRLWPYAVTSGVLLALYALYVKRAMGVLSVSTRIESASGAAGFVFEQWRAIARAAIQIPNEVLPVMIGPYFLLFAGVGVFRPSIERPRDLRAEAFVAYLCVVQCACAALSTYPAPRYLMPVVIAACLWTAQGIVAVSDQAITLVRHRWLRWAPLGGAILILAAHTGITVLSEHVGQLPREPREYKIAGEWMREHLEPGLIFVRKPEIGFYAGMQTTGPTNADTIETAIARAREAGARYLVVDERYTAKMVPGLRPLLNPENAPSALRLVRADLSPYPQGRIVIYEIADAAPANTPPRE